jgi:Collagen triple helix repeat (20 copies)
VRKNLAIAFCLLLLLTQYGSVAETSNVVINGCVNKKTFTVRLVDKCTKDERKVQWNSRGVDGVDGVDGKDGLNGKDGVDGVDGVDGKDGLNGKDGVNGKDGANGRDGVPGIAGPKGEKGDAGSQNTIYWAYLKSKDILTTSTKKVVVFNSKYLGLPVAPAGQDYRLEASVDLTTKVTAQAWVGCYWTSQVMLDKDAGGWGDFDSKYTVSYVTTLRPRAVVFLSKSSDEFILVCTVSENTSITGGYVSAEAVIGSYKGTVGD